MLYNHPRSKRLRKLVNEVFAELPPAARAQLERRTIVIADNPKVLPTTGKCLFAAAFSVSVEKTIFVIYLSRIQLRAEPKDYVKALIAHELDIVRNADPAPPLQDSPCCCPV